MRIEFTDKTVIVTGAAHGFGRAIAVAFAQRGANVWACDLLGDELAETQRLCRAEGSRTAGGRCEVRTVDVTDRDAVFAFVRAAEASAASPPPARGGDCSVRSRSTPATRDNAAS